MNHPLPVHLPPAGPFAWYFRTPLYLRIVAALALGIAFGLVLSVPVGGAGIDSGLHERLRTGTIDSLAFFAALVLRMLSALATPLIFVAVVHALSTATGTGKMGMRMVGILMFNTVVAILVGLLVANLIRPGERIDRGEQAATDRKLAEKRAYSLKDDLLNKLPKSVAAPFVENDTLAIIFLAIAFGVALRMVKRQQQRDGNMAYRTAEQLLDTAFACVIYLLHLIFHLVPPAVFAVVAKLIGTQGFAPFLNLLWFVISVLLALGIMAVYYLVRLRLGSWVSVGRFLRGTSDALMTAFSTASSAATLPVTYECMTKKIGVREESASLGVMVGGTFNHDGTALYEAMAALFIAQFLGMPMDATSQLLIVLMSIVASVGAAGIPEAGLVTMMAVFAAVNLPVEYIPMLLAVDWFLDRCRTAINVMGDMCSTCLLDGRVPGLPETEVPDPEPAPVTG